MRKKGLLKSALLATSLLLIVTSTSAFASPEPNKVSEVKTSNQESKFNNCVMVEGEESVFTDESGKLVEMTKISNVEEYAKQRGIQLTSPTDEIIHIRPIIDRNIQSDTTDPNNNIAPQAQAAAEYYVKNLSGPREACGADLIRLSYYEPPGGVMTINEGVQASYSVNASISVATVVTAAVGFSVTSSFNVSDAQTVTVPQGKKAEVRAYAINHVWQYEIWERDLIWDDYVTDGIAAKPIGVCFDIILRNA